MKKQEFINELENLLELNPGTLTDTAVLRSFPTWDSMQILNVILLAEEKLGYVLDGVAVGRAKTVGDLLVLLDGHFSDK
jgi:acyl carrier protein